MSCHGYCVTFYPIKYAICEICNKFIRLSQQELGEINNYLNGSDVEDGLTLQELKYEVLRRLNCVCHKCGYKVVDIRRAKYVDGKIYHEHCLGGVIHVKSNLKNS